MSFRKPCHMPFRKLIPSFTLTEVKVKTEIRRHTAGAEAVVFRPISERLLWMNTEEQNNTHKSFFENLFENPNVSVLKWNSLIPA